MVLHDSLLVCPTSLDYTDKIGETGSLASFSGPMEVRLQKDQATRATLEVVHRPLEGIGGMSPFTLKLVGKAD
jgi:hypothetical protein